jgi:phage tail sheath protein FI
MPEITKEQAEELTKKIAEQEVAIANVVGELKDDREKRRLLTEERDALQKALEEATKTNVGTQASGDIADVVKAAVEQKLSERDASVAQSNRVAAIEKFVTENKEFHPENDVTGKLREALDAKLKMFNTNGIHSTDEFYSVLKDAASLLGVNTAPQTSSVPTPYASTSRSSITPGVSDDKDVNALEKKLIEKNGWTKERYLSLKAKNPDYMNNLLRLMQG